ncbi:MAG: hypothetical protein IPG10_20770 [Flavobacteriales bacterium]|nr:hypothetical protein [Flavobacteriales bacterium]
MTLTLDRPGYISKTMLIDTHNAPSKEGVIDRTARVELDLALEPQPSDLELCYDKPMGKVEFRCRHRRDPDHRPGSSITDRLREHELRGADVNRHPGPKANGPVSAIGLSPFVASAFESR